MKRDRKSDKGHTSKKLKRSEKPNCSFIVLLLNEKNIVFPWLVESDIGETIWGGRRKKNFTQHKFCLQKFFNHVISFLQRASTTQNKFLSEKKFFKCETVLIFEWTKSDICKFTTEEERLLDEQITCSCSCWSFWEKKCAVHLN